MEKLTASYSLKSWLLMFLLRILVWLKKGVEDTHST
ncbi:unnamed protein product [Brassica oleracea]